MPTSLLCMCGCLVVGGACVSSLEGDVFEEHLLFVGEHHFSVHSNCAFPNKNTPLSRSYVC